MAARRATRTLARSAAGILAALTVGALGLPARAAAIERHAVLTEAAFPTNLAFAPDGRLFYTEKNTGNVRVVDAEGRLAPEPFARFAVANQGETGMLGIALDPAFERRPWIYLYYSDAASGRNVLVRVREEGGVSGERHVLRSFLPWSAGYHNGGDLLFGADGMLYVAVGEGHEPDHAQEPADDGGKIVRLEPDGTIPADNPFGAASAAYTIGHRNSFGLCLDPSTGDIWETENGPDVDDEVNLLRAGANYGWPEVTGDSGGRFADPVAVFPSPEALTGCAVWRGALWFGAANTGVVYRMPLDRAGVAPTEAASFDEPVIDLTVGLDGALYVATSSAIWRLGDGDAGPNGGPAEPSVTPDAAGRAPSSSGPVVMPERDDEGVPPAIPLVAALVLALALAWRMRAGRDLRRSLDDQKPPASERP